MIKMTSLLSALSIVSSGVATRSAVAQATPDTPQILRAAASYLRNSLPPGVVKVYPRAVTGRDLRSLLGTTRNAAEVGALTQGLGATAATLESTRICSPYPGKCRLEGAVAFVAFIGPKQTGDSAAVEVRTWLLTASTRQPVVERDVEIKLARVRGAWRVIASQVLRET